MSTTAILAIIISSIIILFLIIVLTSRTRIKKIYKKYLYVENSANLSGGQFASMSIENLHLDGMSLAVTDGELVDAYYPKKRTLIMSREVCENTSLASLTIVAHELGHAVQHKKNSVLFTLNRILSKITRLLNKFIIPLVIVGLIMLMFSFPSKQIALIILYVALGIFLLHILTKILTIPLEYNASDIGLQYLKEFHFLNKSEIRQAKKLLSVAAQTYIASLFDGIIIFGNKFHNFLFNTKHKRRSK